MEEQQHSLSLPKSQYLVSNFLGCWLLIRARRPPVGLGDGKMPGWQCCRGVTNRVPTGQRPHDKDSVQKGDANP